MAGDGRGDDDSPLGGKKVGKHPTDRGKIGPQRRVFTDGRGVPLGLAVDGAKRNDVTLTRETIEPMAVERPDATPDAPQGRWLDNGYDNDEVREVLDAGGFTAHRRAWGEEAKRCSRRRGSKPGGGW